MADEPSHCRGQGGQGAGLRDGGFNRRTDGDERRHTCTMTSHCRGQGGQGAGLGDGGFSRRTDGDERRHIAAAR